MMTSRERVLAALNHREADRVPIDFAAMRSTGISMNAYMRLREKLGIKGGRVKLYDLMQWLAEPESEVVQRFHGDVIQLHRYSPAFGLDIGEWDEWTTPDGYNVLVPHGFNPIEMPDGSKVLVENDTIIARMPADGHWFDQEYHPLANATSYRDIDAHRFPVLDDIEYDFLCREAKRLREETDYAILASFGGNIFEAGHSDFGYQNFMTLLAGDPDLALYYMDKLADSIIEQLKRWLPAVKDHVDIIQVGDDLGMQTGPQISPNMYKEMIKPFHARIYKYIKEHSNLFIFLHSCGSIYQLLPDLIEIGVDIINPVQYRAAEMEPGRLKREFGKHLTFWGGGCDTQHVLSQGTIQEIEDEVKRMISIFAPGGGFVFTQVHNILREITPERIIALYDTAYRHGMYL